MTESETERYFFFKILEFSDKHKVFPYSEAMSINIRDQARDIKELKC